jgi:alginate O-acetyltransferase complex protein AlgI
MVLAMLISGLWHGAAWMFIIWGALHAFGRIATRELERSDFYRQKIPRIVKQVTVLSFVTFAWIFFRATSLDDAFVIISRIFGTVWSDPQFPLLMLLLILSIWLYQFLYESRLRNVLHSSTVRIAMVIGMIVYLFLFAPSGNQPFIYFQF